MPKRISRSVRAPLKPSLKSKKGETQVRQDAEAAESARRELAALNSTLEDKIKQRTAELEAANESLRELSARLLQMRDEEQRRIARELHDGVGQLVAAIKINNSALAREAAALSTGAAEALAQNDVMLQELHQGIRTISHLLHPPLLDEVGLPVALRWYVDEFSKRSGIDVGLDCPEVLDRASSEREMAVFRIVQECLGNVHRHSASRTAAVRLGVEGGRAHLAVSDKGVGIPANRQQELKPHGRVGIGLRGIRERIAQLGGEFRIDSSSRGTTVTATLPWNAAALSATA